MTGYERVKENENFYYVDYVGRCDIDVEMHSNEDDTKYNTANYYSSSLVAEENARADELMRKLRRFAVEHNECELDWKNGEQGKYFIYFASDVRQITIAIARCYKDFGQIYFSSEGIAKQAIEEYKDDLTWYFTEYCDHVVEAETEECKCCGDETKLQAMKVLGFKCCYECGKELSE